METRGRLEARAKAKVRIIEHEKEKMTGNIGNSTTTVQTVAYFVIAF